MIGIAVSSIADQVHFRYLCTYDLQDPVRNGFDAGNIYSVLRGQVGGGWALEIESFFGPCEMASNR